MRKLASLALLGLLVTFAGCTESGMVDPQRSEASDDLVRDHSSSETLLVRSASGRRWHLTKHGRLGTPTFLASDVEGVEPELRGGKSVEDATIAFLGDNAHLFRMADPRQALRLVRTEVDELGMVHARFRQVERGMVVSGAELLAHYDRGGHLVAIGATVVADLDALDIQPAFDANEAAKRILDAVVPHIEPGRVADLEATKPELVVYALGRGPARLAYEQQVRAVFGKHPAVWVTTIDAVRGEVLRQYNNLQYLSASGKGALGDTKTFEASPSNGRFVMTDTSRGVVIRTHDAKNQQKTAAEGAVIQSSTNLNTWDTGVVGAGSAVDAHVHAGIVFDYYKQRHQRNSIDGVGGPMVSTAHFDNQLDNAFWDGRGMVYGDGDTLFRPLAAALDVVAHEFTHGVTERTSNLTYQDQSGALNEAVSDIFGAFVEHATKPDPVRNWVLAETIAKGGTGIRDMSNPARGDQPAHMSKFFNTTEDNGGVHINSGIVNHAAYLMTVGGTNPTSKVNVANGIGWEKSEKVWYRAATNYFHESTDFQEAALAVVQASKDLGLTQAEQDTIDCAFKATGIMQGACKTSAAPSPTTPASTPTVPTTDDESTASGATEDSEAHEDSAQAYSPVASSGCRAAPHAYDRTMLAPWAFSGFVVLASLRRVRSRRERSSATARARSASSLIDTLGTSNRDVGVRRPSRE